MLCSCTIDPPIDFPNGTTVILRKALALRNKKLCALSIKDKCYDSHDNAARHVLRNTNTRKTLLSDIANKTCQQNDTNDSICHAGRFIAASVLLGDIVDPPLISPVLPVDVAGRLIPFRTLLGISKSIMQLSALLLRIRPSFSEHLE